MTLHLQAFVTVLSLINPAVCGMIFESAESSRSRAQRLGDAAKATAAILVILELAALFGIRILNLFGISLDVFSIAGGGVLLWMGFSMLKGSNAGSSSGSSLTPLILFAASPGTITGVITLAVSHSRDALPVTALVSVAAATLVTWLVLMAISLGNVKAGKPGFVRATIQSLMGLIVMAMGTQFAAEGLTNLIKGGGV
ncbi:MAG: MarC family protein [Acidobacteriota bacterium]|nr:MarC family protein [Acidobacteriota bacterium]